LDSSKTFENDRMNAARLFAQTMIVVDDEAIQTQEEVAEPVSNMTTPRRGMKRVSDLPVVSGRPEVQKKSGNILDARKLIEEALNLGIICSVLRAKKGPGLKNKILKAARNADIVTLDWEIENDDGKLATDLTVGIVKSDIRQNGRIRLIAIYTSTRNRTKIMDDIRKRLISDCKGTYKLENDSILSDPI